MSGLLAACPAPCAQCGPRIGGSFLFGFRFGSWAANESAHKSKAANESHLIMCFSSWGREAAMQTWILLPRSQGCQRINPPLPSRAYRNRGRPFALLHGKAVLSLVAEHAQDACENTQRRIGETENRCGTTWQKNNRTTSPP